MNTLTTLDACTSPSGGYGSLIPISIFKPVDVPDELKPYLWHISGGGVDDDSRPLLLGGGGAELILDFPGPILNNYCVDFGIPPRTLHDLVVVPKELREKYKDLKGEADSMFVNDQINAEISGRFDISGIPTHCRILSNAATCMILDSSPASDDIGHKFEKVSGRDILDIQKNLENLFTFRNPVCDIDVPFLYCVEQNRYMGFDISIDDEDNRNITHGGKLLVLGHSKSDLFSTEIETAQGSKVLSELLLAPHSDITSLVESGTPVIPVVVPLANLDMSMNINFRFTDHLECSLNSKGTLLDPNYADVSI